MNRNKLLALFVSNLANAIVHQILEKAIDKPEIAQGYNKEVLNSWNIAKRYREKIQRIWIIGFWIIGLLFVPNSLSGEFE